MKSCWGRLKGRNGGWGAGWWLASPTEAPLSEGGRPARSQLSRSLLGGVLCKERKESNTHQPGFLQVAKEDHSLFW